MDFVSHPLADLTGSWTTTVSTAATVAGIGSTLVLRTALHRGISAALSTPPRVTRRLA